MSIAVKSRDPTLGEGVKRDVFKICILSALDFDNLISFLVQQAFTGRLTCRRLVATNKRRKKNAVGYFQKLSLPGDTDV